MMTKLTKKSKIAIILLGGYLINGVYNGYQTKRLMENPLESKRHSVVLQQSYLEKYISKAEKTNTNEKPLLENIVFIERAKEEILTLENLKKELDEKLKENDLRMGRYANQAWTIFDFGWPDDTSDLYLK